MYVFSYNNHIRVSKHATRMRRGGAHRAGPELGVFGEFVRFLLWCDRSDEGGEQREPLRVRLTPPMLKNILFNELYWSSVTVRSPVFESMVAPVMFW